MDYAPFIQGQNYADFPKPSDPSLLDTALPPPKLEEPGAFYLDLSCEASTVQGSSQAPSVSGMSQMTDGSAAPSSSFLFSPQFKTKRGPSMHHHYQPQRAALPLNRNTTSTTMELGAHGTEFPFQPGFHPTHTAYSRPETSMYGQHSHQPHPQSNTFQTPNTKVSKKKRARSLGSVGNLYGATQSELITLSNTIRNSLVHSPDAVMSPMRRQTLHGRRSLARKVRLSLDSQSHPLSSGTAAATSRPKHRLPSSLLSSSSQKQKGSGDHQDLSGAGFFEGFSPIHAHSRTGKEQTVLATPAPSLMRSAARISQKALKHQHKASRSRLVNQQQSAFVAHPTKPMGRGDTPFSMVTGGNPVPRATHHEGPFQPIPQTSLALNDLRLHDPRYKNRDSGLRAHDRHQYDVYFDDDDDENDDDGEEDYFDDHYDEDEFYSPLHHRVKRTRAMDHEQNQYISLYNNNNNNINNNTGPLGYCQDPQTGFAQHQGHYPPRQGNLQPNHHHHLSGDGLRSKRHSDQHVRFGEYVSLLDHTSPPSSPIASPRDGHSGDCEGMDHMMLPDQASNDGPSRPSSQSRRKKGKPTVPPPHARPSTKIRSRVSLDATVDINDDLNNLLSGVAPSITGHSASYEDGDDTEQCGYAANATASIPHPPLFGAHSDSVKDIGPGVGHPGRAQQDLQQQQQQRTRSLPPVDDIIIVDPHDDDDGGVVNPLYLLNTGLEPDDLYEVQSTRRRSVYSYLDQNEEPNTLSPRFLHHSPTSSTGNGFSLSALPPLPNANQQSHDDDGESHMGEASPHPHHNPSTRPSSRLSSVNRSKLANLNINPNGNITMKSIHNIELSAELLEICVNLAGQRDSQQIEELSEMLHDIHINPNDSLRRHPSTMSVKPDLDLLDFPRLDVDSNE